jgi:hypothetical protein
MREKEEPKPTFRRPEKPEVNPLSDQAAYFDYWEAQRLERLRREREDEDGLSIYEQS